MDSPYIPQREHGPANTLISDFWPPELRENKRDNLLHQLQETNTIGSLKGCNDLIYIKSFIVSSSLSVSYYY